MMIETLNVSINELEGELTKRVSKRLITITCIERDDGFEVIYHFDGKNIENLKVMVKKNQKMPDMSKKIPEAKIYEQDIQEQYNLDFGLPKKRLFKAEVE